MFVETGSSTMSEAVFEMRTKNAAALSLCCSLFAIFEGVDLDILTVMGEFRASAFS